MRCAILLLSLLILSAGGCSEGKKEGPPPGPQTMTVSLPIKRKITEYQDYTGQTAAVDSVKITSRVTGYLNNINFTEGAEIKEGAVLFEIDPRPYQDSYDAAQAQLAQNEASLELARNNNERYKKLDKDEPGAVSKQQLVTYQSQEDQAFASVNYAKATLRTAKLNLDWTKVTAPVSGRIGRKLVTRGNLIVADQTILTTVVSQDPMWVYFNMDEYTVLRVEQSVREGKLLGGGADSRWRIQIGLANETGWPHQGYVDFTDNTLTQATGTLLQRGLFANPKPAKGERVLTPGLFVRVHVPVSPPHDALLVSQGCVGTDQDVKYLYVLDKDDKVERRAVTLGIEYDRLQVITKGINENDRIVVLAVQQARPGLAVQPKLEPMPTPEGPAHAQPPVVQSPGASKAKK